MKSQPQCREREKNLQQIFTFRSSATLIYWLWNLFLLPLASLHPVLTVFVFTGAEVDFCLLPPSRLRSCWGGAAAFRWIWPGFNTHTLWEVLSRGDNFKVSAAILYLRRQIRLSLLLLLLLPSHLWKDCIKKRNKESSTHSHRHARIELKLLVLSEEHLFLLFEFPSLASDVTQCSSSCLCLWSSVTFQQSNQIHSIIIPSQSCWPDKM